ncbi:hypothetical protein J3Q64DRAFT_1374905 [Phycomyces blakesleeanus]|uniref:Uncharacterized protein n=1 Tax=Phycomyces blakesleeanus TaxID=4837 RepID=A0ABR3AIX1_PHYBL
MIFSSYATQLAPAESVDNLPDWHAYNDYLSNTPVSTLAQNQLERKSRSGDFSKLVVNTSLDSINANNSTTNNPNYTISSSNNNNNNNNNSLYASSTYRQRSALLTPNQTADHGDHSDQNQNQNQSRDRDRDRDPELWKHSRSPSLQSPGQHIYRYNNSSNNNNNNNNINNHATLESPTDYGYQQPSPLMTPSVSPRRDKEKDKDKDKDRGKNPNRLSVFTFFKKSHHSSSNKKSEKSLSSPDYHNQHNTSNSIHRSPIRDNSCDSQKSKSRRFSMVFSNSQKKKQALSISSTIQPMSPQRTEAVTITPTAAAGGRCLDNLSGVVLDPRNPSSLMQLSNPIDDEGTTGEEYVQTNWCFIFS